MASTTEAARQLRTYPAFPAAPHRGGGEPVLFIAFFLRNPRGGGLPSDEAYLHGPVTNAQRLTSKAHMSEPRWRDARPSRPYGGEPGGRTPRREPRGSDPRRAGDGRRRGDDAATRRMPAETGLTKPVAPPPVDSRSVDSRPVDSRAVDSRPVDSRAVGSPAVTPARDGTSRRAANGAGRS